MQLEMIDELLLLVDFANYVTLPKPVRIFYVQAANWVSNNIGPMDCAVYTCLMMDRQGDLEPFNTSSANLRASICMKLWRHWGNMKNCHSSA